MPLPVSDHQPNLQEVVDKLAAVGDPDQLAIFFEEQGIQGYTGDATRCAIAEYVKREVELPVCAGYGGVSYIGTAIDMVKFRNPETGKIHDRYRGLKDFIDRFDNRDYPQLVKGDFREV